MTEQYLTASKKPQVKESKFAPRKEKQHTNKTNQKPKMRRGPEHQIRYINK